MAATCFYVILNIDYILPLKKVLCHYSWRIDALKTVDLQESSGCCKFQNINTARTTMTILKAPLLFFTLLLFSTALVAQSNIRGWSADGQVWIVWEAEAPLPETFAIYASSEAFTRTSEAALAGRLFKNEYGPFALREQVDTAGTYRIPDENGGTYQLAANEALFVYTPHKSGALYFAVVAWGDTLVVPGVNGTFNPVSFQYNPLTDPVECHLQQTFISPFDQNYVCFAFYMWADGRQNQWENRPDFPVMANAAKNGMPSLFLVSAPIGIDTTTPFPLSVWLHGGGGTARQSLAGSRLDIRLNPQKGILVAHNDDLFGYILNTLLGTESVSRHFGWRKHYDPFTGDPPLEVDTIVNYTQRRYLWIDQWLMRHFNIDPARININGHSMGSRGTTMMAKAFPDHYATATILNNGFIEDGDPAPVDVVFGTSADNFPTTLKGYDGATIHFSTATDLETRLSAHRDLPLIRSFHGKNDDGDSNAWDADVVDQYHKADSLGWGAQLFWSERAHGPDTGPDYDDHWINGFGADEQTIVDDIAYEERVFRSDVSYPAFFNHRLDSRNNDPGDGTPGTGPNGVGDDWGTWGGYHRWDWDAITDEADHWEATAWLESTAEFDHDNCPQDVLVADMAIRKPVLFKPVTGTTILWSVRDFTTNQILQEGTTVVRDDNLVVIPNVEVYRQSLRKVKISVVPIFLSTEDVESSAMTLTIAPNPSYQTPIVKLTSAREMDVTFRLSSMDGYMKEFQKHMEEGENRFLLPVYDGLTSGMYVLSMMADSHTQHVRWVKL